MSPSPPSTGTPCMRRPRSLRVVVHEADDVLARRLAELAEQAPAAASGADDQRAPPARGGRGTSQCARNSARSPKREAPISTMPKSASTT